VNKAPRRRRNYQNLTAGYLFIDTEQQTASYAGAGHPPLLLWRQQEKEVLEIRRQGIILGQMEETSYKQSDLSIDYHLKHHYPRLKPAMQIAREMRIRLESIFPSLDDLGLMTCFRCPDVCCLSTSPWYDLRDLIFLHFNRLPIPLTQTILGFYAMLSATLGFSL
jgi:hypothetical protein